MEESTGERGWPILKRKHGDATNFPPAAVYRDYIRVLYDDQYLLVEDHSNLHTGGAEADQDLSQKTYAWQDSCSPEPVKRARAPAE